MPSADELLDLSKYQTEPKDGSVVGWPKNGKPAEGEKNMEFVVTVKALKAKASSESEEAPSSSETVSRDEL